MKKANGFPQYDFKHEQGIGEKFEYQSIKRISRDSFFIGLFAGMGIGVVLMCVIVYHFIL